MKTITNQDALAGTLGLPPASARPHQANRPNGNDHDITSTGDPTSNAEPNETDLPMNTFAPVDELDELDPDIQRPPDASLDERAELDASDSGEPVGARRPVARCADGNGTLVGLFFSDHVVDIARAKAMCGLCPLAEQCLADALDREEPWGVWGGQLLSGGRIIADKRPCGRPPKVPRPDVVYDEMGPVGISLIPA